MSEFNGEPLQTVKVYDEDEEVEVKYEPFDSELIRESEILRHDSGCFTCRKVIKKITAHLTDHVGSSSNDVAGLTEPPEYIVDPIYIIKIEPEKSGPGDVGIMNDTQRPGSHDSRNSGQRQWKVLDFDTGQCRPDCEICKKYIRELREHSAINHPQLQVQPGCAAAPMPELSTVYGPLKTLEYKILDRPYLRQIGRYVDGKKILKVVLTPEMKEKNRRRKTQTSKRAGYAEESIATHPSSSKPVKKKSRLDSTYDSDIINIETDSNEPSTQKSTIFGPLKTIDCASAEAYRFRHFQRLRKPVGEKNTSGLKDAKITKRTTQTSQRAGYPEEDNVSQPSSSKSAKKSRLNSNWSDQNKNKVIEPRTRRGENSDSESKSKQNESERKSSNEIENEVELSELNPTSAVTTGEKASHENNLTDHVSHTGGMEDTTQTGDDFTEMSKTTVGGESVVMIHGGGEPMKTRKLDQTDTGEKQAAVVLAGGRLAKMSRIAGKLPKLTLTGDKPSITTRIVEKSSRLTRSGGKRKSTKMLEPKILKRPTSSESKSISPTPLLNSYNCKKCGRVCWTEDHLWRHNYVAHIDKRYECGECDESFLTRNALTLHEKSHMVRKNLHVENGREKLTEHVVTLTGGDSAKRKATHISGEPVIPVKMPSSNSIEHEGGKGTQNLGKSSELTCAGGREERMTYSESELEDTAHIEYSPAQGTTIGGKPENMDRCAVTSRISTNMTLGEEKRVKIINAGGKSTNMNRVGRRSLKMPRTKGKLAELSHTEGRRPKMACKSFDRSAALTLRKSVDIVFPCDECGINFRSSDRLSDHKTHNALGTLHKCGECGKGFETLNLLTMHKRIHMRNFPFECDKCNTRFKTQSDLITHMQTHGGQKLFGCDVCWMRFKTDLDLMTHMVIHCGEKPFRCDICVERFKRREQWNTHMAIHSGEKGKRHRCGSCGKGFNRKAQLSDHRVIHSPRPFKCYFCEQSYKVLWQLSRHINRHNEWKPFSCEICQERFKSLSVLTSHWIIHTKERPFKCDTCGRNFKRSADLNKHKMGVHSGERR